MQSDGRKRGQLVFFDAAGETQGDDKTKTWSPDIDRINVHEVYKVRNWAKKFGVTPNEHKGLELFRSQAPGKWIDRKQYDLQ